MPSPEARAAFDAAAALTLALHDLASREQSLLERIRESKSAAEVDEFRDKIRALRSVGEDLATHYSDAIDRYSEAVKRALSLQR